MSKRVEGILLGSHVVDHISGLKGVAIGVTTWLNGCVRVIVQPKAVKDTIPDPQSIDVQQIKVLKEPKEDKPKKSASGGPYPTPKQTS